MLPAVTTGRTTPRNEDRKLRGWMKGKEGGATTTTKTTCIEIHMDKTHNTKDMASNPQKSQYPNAT